MGKALANKVSKATRDYKGPTQSRHFADLPAKHRKQSDTKRIGRGTFDLAEDRYVKLKPTSTRYEGRTNTTAFSPYRPGKDSPQKYTDSTRSKPVSRGYANAQAALTSYRNKWKREDPSEYAIGQSIGRNRQKKHRESKDTK